MAVVRVQSGEGAGGRGTVEIDIVDLATEKVADRRGAAAAT